MAKKRPFAVGDIVGKVALKNAYDAYVFSVLADRLQRISAEKKGGRDQYKILQPMPTPDEYLTLRSKRYTISVDSLIDDGYQIAEDLYNEVQEVYDNMPESLQSSDRGSRLEEAASSCEEVYNNKPEVPEIVASVQVVYLPSLDASSRSDRASDANGMMTTAAQAIRDFIEEKDGDEDEPLTEDQVSELNDLADQIESDADTIGGIDFPGMYG